MSKRAMSKGDMSKRLWLAAVPLVAGAILALTTGSAWAWTQQTVAPNGNGNYNFNYGPTDDKYKSGDSTNKSDPNSPGFHFNAGHGDANGFRSFGGSNNTTAPSPYFRTFGN
jgi:hypothetical protein